MDTSKAVTHLGLCAGYGGIELGLQRAIPSLRTIALCEVEAFAIANLVAKMESGLMDPAPIWPDLKTFPWAAFRDRVDILTGGYPCQPFSAAGQRRGKDDPRHLWPYIADGIRLLRPRCCFFENVEGHISLGLSDVIEDLAGMGYRTTWGIFSASEVGAPHQRKRIFILAVASGLGGAAGISRSLQRHEGQSGESDDGGDQAAWPSRPGEQQYGWEPPRVVADARCRQHGGREISEGPIQTAQGELGEAMPMGNAHSPRPQERQGQRGVGIQGIDSDGGEDAERQTQPPLGGDVDGPASGLDYAELCVTCDNRTDELRLLGNGVVPATAELAYRTLMRELVENHG
jgi:DNA (cytosine-5)-methyltransferase 1